MLKKVHSQTQRRNDKTIAQLNRHSLKKSLLKQNRRQSEQKQKGKYIIKVIQTQGLNDSYKKKSKLAFPTSSLLNCTSSKYINLNQKQLKLNKKKFHQHSLVHKCKQNINKIHALNKLIKQLRQQQKTLHQQKHQNCTVKTIRFLQKIKTGNFASVYKAKFLQTGRLIAIKKIYFDSSQQQRQEQICKVLNNNFIIKIIGIYHNEQHPETETQQIMFKRQSQNFHEKKMIVINQEKDKVKSNFKKKNNHKLFFNYTESQPVSSKNKVCNIIMDLYDCDLNEYTCLNSSIDPLNLKLFAYQILRGILYLHSNNICHRDIKPHNILIKKHRLVISDFSSAKVFSKGKTTSVSYVCSRYYRAPQLIFGQKFYDFSIDIWAIGCVFAQMILKKPIFCGSSTIDQLISILRVLGTPNWRNLSFAKQNVQKIPYIQGKGLKNVLFKKCSQNFIDLIEKMLVINPLKRINAAQALSHSYFDEFRDQLRFSQISKQFEISSFLKFNRDELKKSEHFKNKLVPFWFTSH